MSRSHSGSVRAMLGRYRYLRYVQLGAIVICGIQAYIIWRVLPLKPNETVNPDAVRVLFWSAGIAFGCGLLRRALVPRMRWHWDRAMVSNLARNIGGDYSQRERDAIADIIVKPK